MTEVSLGKIFAVFTKIGAFTIGGGYMMVPAIQDEMSRRNWISDDELPDIVALSQSAPGLLTVNMAIFAGYKLRGVPGSVVATLGCILAPFITILLIAMFFANFKDIPIITKIFMGVRPVAVAIIAAYVVKLLRKNGKWWAWAITFATLICVAVLQISAIYILLVVMVFAAAISCWRQRKI